MRPCVLFVQSAGVPSILRRFVSLSSSEKSFLAFDALSEKCRNALVGSGFCEAKKPAFNNEDRDAFLKEYIDLIGQVSLDNDSLLWWATDLASRSRFTSLVPDQIFKFLILVEAAKQSRARLFLAIDAPDSIVCSFKKAMSPKKVEIMAPGFTRRWWGIRIYAFAHRIGSVVWNMLRSSYRVFWTKWYLLDTLKSFRKQSQKEFYAIKTFAYDHSFGEEGGFHDPIFGRLPEFLDSKDSVLIFANILGGLRHCLRKIRTCRNRKIIPVELLLTYREVCCYGLKILFFRTKIPKPLVFRDYDISDILDYEQKRTHDKIQPYQLFHYPATQRLARDFKLDHFALTFENYPWERMCLKAVRDHSPVTRCIGYQHAIVPQSAVGMFASGQDLDILPKPDRILVTGEAPKEVMRRYGDWGDIPIMEAGVMRSSYLFGLKPFPRLRSKTILLALEGIFDVYKMFNYVISQIGRLDYRLIVRTHPVLPLKTIARKLHFRVSDYPNIELSQGYSVKEDIERSSVIIYWGTSLCIDGLWLGRPVVHYDTGNVLKYDPIFECDHLKWTVDNETDLHKVITGIGKMDDPAFQSELQKAQAYVRRYFHPATDENLANFVIKGDV